DNFAVQKIFLQSDLFYQRFYQFIFIGERCAEMEIAIMAGLFAKWNMNIDTGHRAKIGKPL
ncbi:MAG: hypothetical protein JWP78_2629, partial [Mucilaginibacter sp.]|nr:hypothetical protein [Mucilaginibacter sp.]